MSFHAFKKGTALAAALILAMTAAAPAMAEEANIRSAKGVVRCVDSVDVFAPVGGQLNPFDWEAGDTVSAGATLFSVRPKQVLAANDGVIRSLRAVVGDQTAATQQQFGALCSIDRTDVMWVDASTKNAYDKPENRAITIGETLRVYNGKDSDPIEAEGKVISVDGKDYVVEIPAGDFDLEDDVKLYRGSDGAYRSGDRVGEGEIERADAIPVTADGVIAGISVTEGQKVKRGDVLFTLDAADTVYAQGAITDAVSERGGVISELFVKSGQNVQKDQLLMTVEPLDSLEFLVDVDELDIMTMKAGDAIQVKVDALNAYVPAAVNKIYPLGVEVLDATKYQVSLTIQNVPAGLLPGMRVTAYWGGPAPVNEAG
jgi:multidrug efflux pump subunit AcrA (membrane-fusion protein)